MDNFGGIASWVGLLVAMTSNELTSYINTCALINDSQLVSNVNMVQQVAFVLRLTPGTDKSIVSLQKKELHNRNAVCKILILYIHISLYYLLQAPVAFFSKAPCSKHLIQAKRLDTSSLLIGTLS